MIHANKIPVLLMLIFLTLKSYGQKYEEGYTIIQKKGKYGLVYYKAGEKVAEVLEPAYEEIRLPYGQDKFGTVIFCKQGRWKAMRFASKYGSDITSSDFDDIEAVGDILDRTFRVSQSGKTKWLIYTTRGDEYEIVTSTNYYDNFSLCNGVAFIDSADKKGMVRLNGEAVTSCLYTSCVCYSGWSRPGLYNKAPEFYYCAGNEGNILVLADEKGNWIKEAVDSVWNLNGNGSPRKLVKGTAYQWDSYHQRWERADGLAEINTQYFNICFPPSWKDYLPEEVRGDRIVVDVNLDNSKNIFMSAPSGWLNKNGFSGEIRVELMANSDRTAEQVKNDIITYYAMAKSDFSEDENILNKFRESIRVTEETVTLNDGRAGKLLFYTAPVPMVGIKLHCYLVAESDSPDPEDISSHVYSLILGGETRMYECDDPDGWKEYFKKILLTATLNAK